MTQREAIREALIENPNLNFDDAMNVIKEKFNMKVPASAFYSVRSEMGYGARRNGKTRLTAESISRVKEFTDSTKIDGFASTLLQILDEMGYATFKESLKVVAQLQK